MPIEPVLALRPWQSLTQGRHRQEIAFISWLLLRLQIFRVGNGTEALLDPLSNAALTRVADLMASPCIASQRVRRDAVEQAKRLKDLERENARLRGLVADLSLEDKILKDVASGHLQPLICVDRRCSAFGRRTAPRGATPPGSPSPLEGTQRDIPERADEDALTRALVTLASEFRHYERRRIAALPQIAGSAGTPSGSDTALRHPAPGRRCALIGAPRQQHLREPSGRPKTNQ